MTDQISRIKYDSLMPYSDTNQEETGNNLMSNQEVSSGGIAEIRDEIAVDAQANQLDSEWKYLPVRREDLSVEESLNKDTQWAVFEPEQSAAFEVNRDAGEIIFGDGETGKIPDSGESIATDTYRNGSGAESDPHPKISLDTTAARIKRHRDD